MKNINLIQFDTEAYADKLKKGGINAQDAETYAKLYADIGADILTNLTEKRLAIKDAVCQLEDKIDRNSSEIQNKICVLENKIDGDFSRLDNKIDKNISKLENNSCRLENKVDNLDSKLLVKLGSLVVACTVIISIVTTISSHIH